MLPGFTLGLNIDPINLCNLKCPFCVYTSQAETGKKIEVQFFKELLAGLDNSVIPVSYINFVGAGEPLLHKQFSQLAQEAKRVVPDVRVTTNGTLLTKEMSETLISSGINLFTISITGSTVDVYKKFQGSGKDDDGAQKQLESVINNIRDL